jgi:hypothetical protein
MISPVVNAKLNRRSLGNLCNCKLASRSERIKNSPTLRRLILPPPLAVETQHDTGLNFGCDNRVLSVSKLGKIHNGALWPNRYSASEKPCLSAGGSPGFGCFGAGFAGKWWRYAL